MVDKLAGGFDDFEDDLTAAANHSTTDVTELFRELEVKLEGIPNSAA